MTSFIFNLGDATGEKFIWTVAIFTGLVVVVPVFFFLGLRRISSFRSLGCLYIVVIATGCFLAHDDADVMMPEQLPGVAPELPNTAASYELLMRYGKAHPLGKSFHTPEHRFHAAAGTVPDASQAAEWRTWLLSHRAAVEADWAELSPVRQWMGELAAFEQIGDRTAPRFDADIITFAPLRAYSQLAAAIAGLRAIDGQGDEAIATLIPGLEVSRRLQLGSKTLVRMMIGSVMQRTAQNAAMFVLETAPVKVELRNRLNLALDLGYDGRTGISHLLRIEDGLFWIATADMRLGDILCYQPGTTTARRPLNFISPLVFNRVRTLKMDLQKSREIEPPALAHDLANFNIRLSDAQHALSRLTFKNLMGHYLSSVRSPAYNNVVKSFWKTEDDRVALRIRLQEKTALTKS